MLLYWIRSFPKHLFPDRVCRRCHRYRHCFVVVCDDFDCSGVYVLLVYFHPNYRFDFVFVRSPIVVDLQPK